VPEFAGQVMSPHVLRSLDGQPRSFLAFGNEDPTAKHAENADDLGRLIS
jgi:hypothetical protein